jgi:hypothetical protein
MSSSLRRETSEVEVGVSEARVRRMLPFALRNWRRRLGVRLGPRAGGR